MSTPNDAIALRDYFAAAALSGIVVKRLDLDAANKALDLPATNETEIKKRNSELEKLKKQFKKDMELAYVYAKAAIEQRAKGLQAMEAMEMEAMEELEEAA